MVKEEYFDLIMIIDAVGEPAVTSMGIKAGKGWALMQRKTGRLEVERVLERLKYSMFKSDIPLHSYQYYIQ